MIEYEAIRKQDRFMNFWGLSVFYLLHDAYRIGSFVCLFGPKSGEGTNGWETNILDRFQFVPGIEIVNVTT